MNMFARTGGAVFLSVLSIGFTGVSAATDELAYRNAVFQPTFVSRGKHYVSGKGFVTSFNGRKLFITSIHLIGTVGGFDRNYVGSEIAGIIDRIVAVSTDDSSVRISTPRVLTLLDTEAVSSSRVNGDVAAFILDPDSDYVTLPLATTLPKEGETVRLLSPVFSNDRMLHKAVVTESSNDFIMYRYLDKGIITGATSGAPVINALGEVVAISVARKSLVNLVLGIGNPAVAIREHLEGGRPEAP